MPERTEQLHLRVTLAEMALLRQAAEKAQLSVSDFVRMSVLEGAAAVVEGRNVQNAYNSTGVLIASLAARQARLNLE